MVEVWYGDQFVDVMTYDEFLYLYEADSWFSCCWCEGYGP